MTLAYWLIQGSCPQRLSQNPWALFPSWEGGVIMPSKGNTTVSTEHSTRESYRYHHDGWCKLIFRNLYTFVAEYGWHSYRGLNVLSIALVCWIRYAAMDLNFRGSFPKEWIWVPGGEWEWSLKKKQREPEVFGVPFLWLSTTLNTGAS